MGDFMNLGSLSDLEGDWSGDELASSSLIGDVFYIIQLSLMNIAENGYEDALVEMIKAIYDILREEFLSFLISVCELSMPRLKITLEKAGKTMANFIKKSRTDSPDGPFIPWIDTNDDTTALWGDHKHTFRLLDLLTHDEQLKCDMFGVESSLASCIPKKASTESENLYLQRLSDSKASPSFAYPLAISNVTSAVTQIQKLTDLISSFCDEYPNYGMLLSTLTSSSPSTASSRVNIVTKEVDTDQSILYLLNDLRDSYDKTLNVQIYQLFKAFGPILKPSVDVLMTFNWDPKESEYSNMVESMGCISDDGASIWSELFLMTVQNISHQVIEPAFSQEVIERFNLQLLINITSLFEEILIGDRSSKLVKFSSWGASVLESDVRYIAQVVATMSLPLRFSVREALALVLEALEVLNLDSLHEFDDLQSREREWMLQKHELCSIACQRTEWPISMVSRYFESRQFIGRMAKRSNRIDKDLCRFYDESQEILFKQWVVQHRS